MISFNDSFNCCGCGACASICPQKCISLKPDHEGFCYPMVNKESCIECNLCEKTCPILSPPKYSPIDQKCFVVQHKNDTVLKESTSGGFFTAIAKWVISKGGIVFGVRMTENLRAEHCYIDNEEQLYLFRNSKYVQSSIGDSYKNVKRFLDEGRVVLFSGTPCQLEGLFSFLKRKYESLYTVDVACRAVPSPLVLEKYLTMQASRMKREIKKVRFRDKFYGYNYSSLSLYTNNELAYHEGIDTDPYLRSFFSGINIRPSCTTCHFRTRYHRTDYTIWDCYNIRDFDKEMDNNKGATRVLVNTERAYSIIHLLSTELNMREVDPEDAIRGFKEFSVNPTPHKKREDFFKDLNEKPTDIVFDKYFPNSLRHRLEKRIRLLLLKVGIYDKIKRTIKSIYRGEIKR